MFSPTSVIFDRDILSRSGYFSLIILMQLIRGTFLDTHTNSLNPN